MATFAAGSPQLALVSSTAWKKLDHFVIPEIKTGAAPGPVQFTRLVQNVEGGTSTLPMLGRLSSTDGMIEIPALRAPR